MTTPYLFRITLDGQKLLLTQEEFAQLDISTPSELPEVEILKRETLNGISRTLQPKGLSAYWKPVKGDDELELIILDQDIPVIALPYQQALLMTFSPSQLTLPDFPQTGVAAGMQFQQESGYEFGLLEWGGISAVGLTGGGYALASSGSDSESDQSSAQTVAPPTAAPSVATIHYQIEEPVGLFYLGETVIEADAPSIHLVIYDLENIQGGTLDIALAKHEPVDEEISFQYQGPDIEALTLVLNQDQYLYPFELFNHHDTDPNDYSQGFFGSDLNLVLQDMSIGDGKDISVTLGEDIVTDFWSTTDETVTQISDLVLDSENQKDEVFVALELIDHEDSGWGALADDELMDWLSQQLPENLYLDDSWNIRTFNISGGAEDEVHFSADFSLLSDQYQQGFNTYVGINQTDKTLFMIGLDDEIQPIAS